MRDDRPRPRIRGCCGCAVLLVCCSLGLAVILTAIGAKPPIAADTMVDAAGSAASSGLTSSAYTLNPSLRITATAEAGRATPPVQIRPTSAVPGVFVAPPTPTTRVTVVYVGTPPPR